MANDFKMDKDGGSGGQLQDRFIRHQIWLTRLGTGESRRLLEIMDAANVQIKRMILKAGAVETKAKYRRIAAELNKVREELKQNLYGQLEKDFKELAEEETKFTKKVFNDAGITIELGMPSPDHIWTAANFAPYIGSGKNYTYEQYLTSFSDDLYRVWDNELRAGYISGLTAKQITRNVLGSIEENDPGKMQSLRKSLEMNSRDALMEMGHMARKAVYDENDELFSGYKYLATLDSRTCPECFSVDGKVFKHIEDGPELLQHPRCRCLYLPVIKGMENVHGERAAQGGPVDSKMTFEDWIKTQPDTLVKDFLGSARFELYKQGVPIKSFFQDGRQLTLAEVRKLEGLPADTKQSSVPPPITGLNKPVAEAFTERIGELYNRYPAIDGVIKNIDTTWKDKTGLAGWGTNDTLYIDARKMGSIEKLDKDWQEGIAENFYPQGTSWRSIINHELGHGIDYYLTRIERNNDNRGKLLRTNISTEIRRSVLKELGIKVTDTITIKNGLSNYANTNAKEFFAEAFSEYTSSKNPRLIALTTGRIIDKYLLGAK